MGFTFVAAGRFGPMVVLSGEASRPASVTGPFDRESFNSVEQTLTVIVVSFMVAHAKAQGREEAQGDHLFVILCVSAALR
jgi:hypothetical protein